MDEKREQCAVHGVQASRLPAQSGPGGERIHELKIWPSEFVMLKNFTKRYEIRRADRDYQVGDTVILREWDPTTGQYSGNACRAEIIHLTPPEKWGLPADLCVLGINVKYFHTAQPQPQPPPAKPSYRAEDNYPGQEEAE